MKTHPRFGLAVLTIATLLPIALSAVGSRIVFVDDVTLACLPLTIAGGLVWIGRRQSSMRRMPIRIQKRHMIFLSTASLVLLLATHWPLFVAFRLSKPRLLQLANKAQSTAISQDEALHEFHDCLNSLKAHQLHTQVQDVLCAPAVSFVDIRPSEARQRLGMFSIHAIVYVYSYGMVFKLKTLTEDPAEFIYTPYPGNEAVVEAMSGDYHLGNCAPSKVNLGDGWWFVSY